MKKIFLLSVCIFLLSGQCFAEDKGIKNEKVALKEWKQSELQKCGIGKSGKTKKKCEKNVKKRFQRKQKLLQENPEKYFREKK